MDDPVVALIHRVAAIPWGEGRTVEEVLVTKKVGTCTGKHLVLQEELKKLGVPFKQIGCTFKWEDQSIDYPDHLRAILGSGPAWEHGHNFLQIKLAGMWTDVDVTWDPPLTQFGFRCLPEDWEGSSSFIGMDPLIRRWDGIDVNMKKQELIDALPEAVWERRQRFLEGMFKWVAEKRK